MAAVDLKFEHETTTRSFITSQDLIARFEQMFKICAPFEYSIVMMDIFRKYQKTVCTALKAPDKGEARKKFFANTSIYSDFQTSTKRADKKNKFFTDYHKTALEAFKKNNTNQDCKAYEQFLTSTIKIAELQLQTKFTTLAEISDYIADHSKDISVPLEIILEDTFPAFLMIAGEMMLKQRLGSTLSADTIYDLYASFMQARFANNPKPKPGLISTDVFARGKWNAWTELYPDLAPGHAKYIYCKTVFNLLKEYQNHKTIIDFFNTTPIDGQADNIKRKDRGTKQMTVYPFPKTLLGFRAYEYDQFNSVHPIYKLEPLKNAKKTYCSDETSDVSASITAIPNCADITTNLESLLHHADYKPTALVAECIQKSLKYLQGDVKQKYEDIKTSADNSDKADNKASEDSAEEFTLAGKDSTATFVPTTSDSTFSSSSTLASATSKESQALTDRLAKLTRSATDLLNKPSESEDPVSSHASYVVSTFTNNPPIVVGNDTPTSFDAVIHQTTTVSNNNFGNNY